MIENQCGTVTETPSVQSLQTRASAGQWETPGEGCPGEGSPVIRGLAPLTKYKLLGAITAGMTVLSYHVINKGYRSQARLQVYLHANFYVGNNHGIRIAIH